MTHCWEEVSRHDWRCRVCDVLVESRSMRMYLVYRPFRDHAVLGPVCPETCGSVDGFLAAIEVLES